MDDGRTRSKRERAILRAKKRSMKKSEIVLETKLISFSPFVAAPPLCLFKITSVSEGFDRM